MLKKFVLYLSVLLLLPIFAKGKQLDDFSASISNVSSFGFDVSLDAEDFLSSNSDVTGFRLEVYNQSSCSQSSLVDFKNIVLPSSSCSFNGLEPGKTHYVKVIPYVSKDEFLTNVVLVSAKTTTENLTVEPLKVEVLSANSCLLTWRKLAYSAVEGYKIYQFDIDLSSIEVNRGNWENQKYQNNEGCSNFKELVGKWNTDNSVSSLTLENLTISSKTAFAIVPIVNGTPCNVSFALFTPNSVAAHIVQAGCTDNSFDIKIDNFIDLDKMQALGYKICNFQYQVADNDPSIAGNWRSYVTGSDVWNIDGEQFSNVDAVSTNRITIAKDVLPCQVYYIKIRPVLSSDNCVSSTTEYSSWSNILEYHTSLGSVAPRNLVVKNIDYTSISIEWQCDAEDVKFEIFYNGNLMATTKNTNYTISNLDYETTIENIYIKPILYNSNGFKVETDDATESNHIESVTTTLIHDYSVNLDAQKVSDGAIKLTWDACPLAIKPYLSKYVINVFEDKDGEYISLKSLSFSNSETQYTVSGLKKDTQYKFVITPYDIKNHECVASQAFAKTSSFDITSKADLKLSAPKVKTIVASWENLEDASKFVLKYSTKSDMSNAVTLEFSGSQIEGKSIISKEITGLMDATIYYFTLQPFSNFANGVVDSKNISTLMPSSLEIDNSDNSLKATAISHSQVDVQWTALPNNGVDGYKVAYWSKSDKSDIKYKNVEGYNSNKAQITDLDCFTKYSFQVAPYQNSIVGKYSKVVEATTKQAIVKEFAVSDIDVHSAKLTWKRDNLVNGVTAFKISYKEDGQIKNITIDNNGKIDYEKILSDLKEAYNYLVDIQLVIGSKTCTEKKSVSFTSSLNKTTSVIVSGAKPIDYQSIQVDWNSLTELNGIDGYYVYYAENSNMDDAKFVIVNGFESSSKVIDGLKSATKYWFYVKPYQGEIFGAASSIISATTFPKMDGADADIPEITKVVPSDDDVTVSCKKSTKSGVERYLFEVLKDGNVIASKCSSKNENVNGFVDKDGNKLLSGTNYKISVKFVASNNCDDTKYHGLSASQDFSTTISKIKVENFAAIQIKTDQITLGWTPIANKDAITGYTLKYATTQDGLKTASSIQIEGANKNQYLLSSLKPGTLYYFEILPKTNSAIGLTSNTSATTKISKDSKPDDVTVTPGEDGTEIEVCVEPTTQFDGVKRYKIQIIDVESSKVVITDCVVKDCHTYTGLTPGREYKVVVTASGSEDCDENNSGNQGGDNPGGDNPGGNTPGGNGGDGDDDGNLSDEQIETPVVTPINSYTIQNFKASEIKAEQLLLSWDQPTKFEFNKYLLTYGSNKIELENNVNSLEIKGLTPGTKYDFEIVAIVNDANKTIPAKTSAVTKLTGISIEESFLKVDPSYTYVDVEFKPIDNQYVSYYIVEACAGENCKNVKVEASAAKNSKGNFEVRVEELQDDTDYILSITPYDQEDFPGTSVTKAFRTLNFEEAAISLTIVSKHQTSLEISWSVEKVEPTSYKLVLTNLDQNKVVIEKTYQEGIYGYKTSGLLPGNNYQVEVTPYLNNKKGVADSKDFQMDSWSVRDLQVSDIKANSANSSWKEPKEDFDNLVVLEYKVEIFNADTLVFRKHTQDLALSLENLLPATNYVLSVSPWNDEYKFYGNAQELKFHTDFNPNPHYDVEVTPGYNQVEIEVKPEGDATEEYIVKVEDPEGNPITDQDGKPIEIVISPKDLTDSTLVLKPLEDGTEYQIVIVPVIDDITGPADTIKVITKKLSDVVIQKINIDNINEAENGLFADISWIVKEEIVADITGYDVVVVDKVTDIQVDKKDIIFFEDDMQKVKVLGLADAHQFEITVTPLVEQTIKATPKDTTFHTPYNVKVDNVVITPDTTSLLVEWDGITNPESKPEKIEIVIKDKEGNPVDTIEVDYKPGKDSVVVEPLKEGTVYVVEITPKFPDGNGLTSSDTTHTSIENLKVEDVVVTPGDDYVDIEYKEPDDGGDAIDGYEIVIKDKDGVVVCDTIVSSGRDDDKPIHIGGLDPNEDYIVEITPKDKDNNSGTTVEEEFNTYKHLDASAYIDRLWNDVLIVNNSDGIFKEYQWYKDGAPIEGATGQYYCEIGGIEGEYSCVCKDQKGNLYLIGPAHFDRLEGKFSVEVNPNPVSAGTSFNVLVNGLTQEQLSKAKMCIFDVTSILRYKSNNVEASNQVVLQAPGIYVVVVSVEGINYKACKFLVK